MSNVNTILLCGGKINYSNLPIYTNASNSMIPINGKPVIGWILEDLISKKVNDCIVVLRPDNYHLKDYIKQLYDNKIKIKVVEIQDSTSIIHSMKEAIEVSDLSIPTQVILGDTLIRDEQKYERNSIYVQAVEDSSRWCIVNIDADNKALEYHDKKHSLDGDKFALCGYYSFSNSYSLHSSIQDLYVAGKQQMSELLREEGKREPFCVFKAKEWYDFGNLDNLLESKQRLLQSRYFNSLNIDPVLNTITKVSEYDEKLRDELNWYKLLPNELKVLSPRIISENEIDGQLNLVQEYYGYPTLAEMYLFSDLDTESWSFIFKKLLNIHKIFKKYTVELRREDLESIYIKKTNERIKSLLKNDNWKRRWLNDSIIINKKTYRSINKLFPMIINQSEELCRYKSGSIIHGDFCFSNILFDLNNQIVRLIDPRGSFGIKGVYGDPRYDIAKLRHSIANLYDYIVADSFEVVEKEMSFSYKIYSDNNNNELKNIYDNIIINIGYDVEQIKFIEGLLFLTMLPLHSDNPQRQLAMYLTSTIIFNEYYENNH